MLDVRRPMLEFRYWTFDVISSVPCFSCLLRNRCHTAISCGPSLGTTLLLRQDLPAEFPTRREGSSTAAYHFTPSVHTTTRKKQSRIFLFEARHIVGFHACGLRSVNQAGLNLLPPSNPCEPDGCGNLAKNNSDPQRLQPKARK